MAEIIPQLGKAESNPACIKRRGRLAAPSVSKGSTRRLVVRRVSSSRGLTRITPLTVPNPPTRILIYAGVVSAFFSARYRLDKLPRQLVSQSVARLVDCLVGRTRFLRVVPPSRPSAVALSIPLCVCHDRSPASIDRASRVRTVRRVNREKR